MIICIFETTDSSPVLLLKSLANRQFRNSKCGACLLISQRYLLNYKISFLKCSSFKLSSSKGDRWLATPFSWFWCNGEEIKHQLHRIFGDIREKDNQDNWMRRIFWIGWHLTMTDLAGVLNRYFKGFERPRSSIYSISINWTWSSVHIPKNKYSSRGITHL